MRKLAYIIIIFLLICLISPQPNDLSSNLNSLQVNQKHSPISPSSDPPETNLTWTSRTQLIPQPFGDDSVVAGDHVVVNGTFATSLDVTECELNIWNGFTFSSNRSVIPVSDPEASFEDSIIYDDFDWVVIKGIEPGLTVNVTCNFTSENCDFMAWLGSMDPLLYSYSKSIVDMASDDQPEHDSFIWESTNDTMILGCLNTANSSTGTWTAIVQVGVNATFHTTGSTIALDTYYLESRNQTYNILLTGTTDMDESIILSRNNVSLCNFFSPIVTVNTPYEISLGSDFWNLSWSSTDLNRDDVNFFTVWVSRDAGVTYLYLYGNITATTFIWDKSSWLEGDYILRVIAYSCDITSDKCGFDNPPDSYWPGDYTIGYSASWGGQGIPTVTPGGGLVVDSVGDITYEYGSTGNSVRLYLRFLDAPSSVDYIVRDNGTQWFEGDSYSASSVMVVELDIDGLSLGLHEIEVDFLYYGHVLTSFSVNVIDSDTNGSSQIPLIVSSLVVGAISGILVIVVFTKYKKRG